ncbi:MAG: hypothetical protein MK132_27725 [Lentisphaerales bacterium]|nr:hypothetical protein [Lentisphaerales bacterium]
MKFLIIFMSFTLSLLSAPADYDLSKVKIGSTTKNLEKVFGAPNKHTKRGKNEVYEFNKKIGVDCISRRIGIYYIVLTEGQQPQEAWEWITKLTGQRQTDFTLIKEENGNKEFESKNKRYKCDFNPNYLTVYSTSIAEKIRKENQK